MTDQSLTRFTTRIRYSYVTTYCGPRLSPAFAKKFRSLRKTGIVICGAYLYIYIDTRYRVTPKKFITLHTHYIRILLIYWYISDKDIWATFETKWSRTRESWNSQRSLTIRGSDEQYASKVASEHSKLDRSRHLDLRECFSIEKIRSYDQYIHHRFSLHFRTNSKLVSGYPRKSQGGRPTSGLFTGNRRRWRHRSFIGTSYRPGQSRRAEWVSYLHRRYRRVASRQDVPLKEIIIVND